MTQIDVAKQAQVFEHPNLSTAFEKIENQSDKYTFTEAETDMESRLIKTVDDATVSTVKAKQIETEVLKDLIAANPFFLEAQQVQKCAALLGRNPIDLLEPLVLLTKSFARPPISNYYVSVVGLGKSGNIYLGVNLEFKNNPLNQAVHAEQFLITNAKMHGETELAGIALSAPPCGHCRQFLNKIGEGDQTVIRTPGNPDTTLPALLPKSFGPKELGRVSGLLNPGIKIERAPHSCALTDAAIEAAHSSYAPYTEAISGIAIRTKDGAIYSGSYLENVAYNPSLSPLQTALVAFVADQRHYHEIEEVVLAEKEGALISQKETTAMVLKGIAPDAAFRTFFISTTLLA